MAFDAGSIVVYFKAQTAELVKGIEDTNKKLDGFKKGIEGLGAFAAFKAVTGELLHCVEASSEAEINVRKLQAVVSAQADVSTFEALAVELSHVTTFSDDAAMSALSLLGKFNLTDQQMASMLPKVADFAAFMGNDLPSAAESAGRAISNGSSGLRGLGLAFTDAEKKAFEMASQQERVNTLLEKMSGKFGGVAEAVASTGAGGMKQFHNEMAELEETIGKLVDSPIGSFFGGLAEIVRGVSGAIGHMSDSTREVVGVLAMVAGGFTAATVATIAWGAATAFLGGMPAILTAIGTAAGTVATTIGTMILPLIAIASTVVMIEGMISRIRSGNFNMNESFIDGIKNNFKAGLADIKEGVKDVFQAPASSATSLADGLKALDNTARATATKVATMDFKKELLDAIGDVFENLGNSIGIDFAKHVDENGVALTGNALTASQRGDAVGTQGISDAVNPSLSGWDSNIQGMDSTSIAATAATLSTTIAGTDIALAGLQGGFDLLVGKMGGAAQAINNSARMLSNGDVAGAVGSIVVEMLTRTKSFGALMQAVEGIFTAASQVLEPIVAAALPFLQVIGDLVPVLVALEPGLKILGAIVKAIGDTLRNFVQFIGKFWNSLIDTLANLVDALPFIGDDLAKSIRNAKINLDAKVADDTTTPPVPPAVTNVASESIKGLGEAAKKATEQITNVPEGFKVAAARYAAIIRGEGDDVAGVPAMGLPAASGPLSTLAGLRGGGPNTRPAMLSAALPDGGNVTNIQNLIVQTPDPEAAAKAVQEAAARQSFVNTGTRTNNPGAGSMRNFYGR